MHEVCPILDTRFAVDGAMMYDARGKRELDPVRLRLLQGRSSSFGSESEGTDHLALVLSHGFVRRKRWLVDPIQSGHEMGMETDQLRPTEEQAGLGTLG